MTAEPQDRPAIPQGGPIVLVADNPTSSPNRSGSVSAAN
jgi:hypothetical protein